LGWLLSILEGGFAVATAGCMYCGDQRRSRTRTTPTGAKGVGTMHTKRELTNFDVLDTTQRTSGAIDPTNNLLTGCAQINTIHGRPNATTNPFNPHRSNHAIGLRAHRSQMVRSRQPAALPNRTAVPNPPIGLGCVPLRSVFRRKNGINGIYAASLLIAIAGSLALGLMRNL
jgi:hypothetical protein